MIFSKRMFILILVIVLMLSGVVEAKQLNDSWVRQEKSNWCWAASAENSVLYERNITRHQKDAVKYIKGGILNPYPNVGGTAKDTKDAAQYISNYTENYGYIEEKQTYSFLKSQIDRQNITITMAGYYKNNERTHGHATIIVGYNDENRYITYFDPSDGKKYTCSYISYCDGSFNGRKFDMTIYNYDRNVC